MKINVLAFLGLFFISLTATAQVTTSNIRGTIVDDQNVSLIRGQYCLRFTAQQERAMVPYPMRKDAIIFLTCVSEDLIR